MTSRRSDEFSELIYRTVRDQSETNPRNTSDVGPSSSCSPAALIGGHPVTAKQRRHIKECPFCARLAIRLARTTGGVIVEPPSYLP